MEFPSQKYWSGLPFPSSGYLPDPGIEPGSPALQADSFTVWATKKALIQLRPLELLDLFTFPPVSFAQQILQLKTTDWDNLSHMCKGTPSLKLHIVHFLHKGFPEGSYGKESDCNARNWGSIPGSGRYPGEGNICPLQYSWLVNPMDRGAWRAIVYGVAKSRTWLSD